MSASSTNASIGASVPASEALFYATCPHCGSQLMQPFNRLGGPQLSNHRCRGHQSMRYFLVAASGDGYVAYPFDRGEHWEPVFERWITYWRSSLRTTVGLRFSVPTR